MGRPREQVLEGIPQEKGTPSIIEDQHTQQDPTQQYHQPDQQSEQELEHPGIESEMQPDPDYGYKTYRGSGRLEGKAAVITGARSLYNWLEMHIGVRRGAAAGTALGLLGALRRRI